MSIDNVEFSAEETAALRDQAAPEPATVPPAPAPTPAAPPALSQPVTAAEPAPQPAPDPQTRNEGGQFDAEGRLVPLPELMRERDRRRELQDKFEASERQRIADMAKLSERLEALQRGILPIEQAQRQQAEEDPMARLQRLEQAQRQEQEQRRAAEAQERLSVEYQRKADEFGRDTPDFRQAYDHLMRVRAAEMAAAGVPDHQIPRLLVQGELQLAANALNEGVNPAQRIYGMAKALGYSVAPAAPAAAPAPSPAAADEARRLATVQAGQAASASLATAGGSPPPDLTLETLLSMDEDDFKSLATNPKKWRKAMGG